MLFIVATGPASAIDFPENSFQCYHAPEDVDRRRTVAHFKWAAPAYDWVPLIKLSLSDKSMFRPVEESQA